MYSRVNYNYIAPFYDRLCQMVFGQRVKNAQIESLEFIPHDSDVLIVGGGTGWILEEICKIHQNGLSITYIDISSKMIKLSKNRGSSCNKVSFINASIENADLQNKKYDVVITPFLFDGFQQDTLQSIFNKLDKSLISKGLWLYTDFYLTQKSKWWQISLLKIMYFAFRMVCRIEASRLPDVATCFSSYDKIKENNFCSNFISMQVLQKKHSGHNDYTIKS